MKWTGEYYKCRKCGEIYPYSLSKCSCGGVCDKIADAPSNRASSDALENKSSVLSNASESNYSYIETLLKNEEQKHKEAIENEIANLNYAVEEACSKNKYLLAVSCLEQILKRNPNSVEAHRLLELCKSKIKEERDLLEHIAYQFNQASKRKAPLYFLISFINETESACIIPGIGMILLFFGILGIGCCILDALGASPMTEPLNIWYLLASLAICILGGILFFPLFCSFYKIIHIFKNGFFTLGNFSQGELVYRDRSGKEYFWTPPWYYRLFHYFLPWTYRLPQPFLYLSPSFLDAPNDNYLVVVGKKPKNFIVFNAHSLPEIDSIVCFSFTINKSFVSDNTPPDIFQIYYDYRKTEFLNFRNNKYDIHE